MKAPIVKCINSIFSNWMPLLTSLCNYISSKVDNVAEYKQNSQNAD